METSTAQRSAIWARRMVIAALLLAALPVSAAHAQGLETDWVSAQANKARARLSAGGQDGRLYALVEIELEPGWKTYWRNPGDAGLPPEFDWSGSQNVARAAPLYPAPHRFIDKAGETIGYKDRVVFPVEVERLDASQPSTVALTLQYGVCKEICIPAEAVLSLALPGGELPQIGGDVLSEVPRGQGSLKPGDPAIVRAVAVTDGADPRVEIEVKLPEGVEAADAFLDAEGGVYVPSPEQSTTLGERHVLFVAKLTGGVDIGALKERAMTATVTTSTGASTAPVTKNQ